MKGTIRQLVLILNRTPCRSLLARVYVVNANGTFVA
jgi:hypothetical protein